MSDQVVERKVNHYKFFILSSIIALTTTLGVRSFWDFFITLVLVFQVVFINYLLILIVEQLVSGQKSFAGVSLLVFIKILLLIFLFLSGVLFGASHIVFAIASYPFIVFAVFASIEKTKKAKNI